MFASEIGKAKSSTNIFLKYICYLFVHKQNKSFLLGGGIFLRWGRLGQGEKNNFILNLYLM